jgi:hypothetical protein
VIGGLATALACYPRLLLWAKRPLPLWYLELNILLGTIVLWAFVFAWHKPYTNRPVFNLRCGLVPFLSATAAGLLSAVVLYVFLDPTLRLRTPEDYPANLTQWVAMTLFSASFSLLFLIFAPFAWLLRLLRHPGTAAVLTVAFGVFVLLLKVRSSPQPCPAALFFALVLVRLGLGLLYVSFYLRGGVLLVWWMGLLLEARHLIALGRAP